MWLISHIGQRMDSGSTGLQLESGVAAKTELNATLKKLISRAELIKKSRKDLRAPKANPLSEESQSLVLKRSSTINNSTFSIWTPGPEPFDLSRIALSEPQPTLSKDQIAHGAEYRSALTPERTVYEPGLKAQDIVQDVVSDCSLVAALEAMTVHDTRFGTMLAPSVLYPQVIEGSKKSSIDGRYRVKLHLNGADRSVTVDDELPHDALGRLVCARTADDRQIFPGLAEKAYLKVTGGGYEFSGSNPSVDLHILVGWVPEQVHLRKSGAEGGAFQGEKGWKRVYAAWNRGQCLLTAGSGPSEPAVSESAVSAIHLSRSKRTKNIVPSHAYCIIDMYETPDKRRFVTLLNPWHEDKIKEVQPGDERAFSLTWEDFCARLDSLFLNWNPGQWAHRAQLHLTWESSQVGVLPRSNQEPAQGQEPPRPGSAATFPLLLTIEKTESALSQEEGDDDLCVLLVRHIISREDEQAGSKHVTLRLSERHDVTGTHPARSREGAWVDSTHYLLKRKLARQKETLHLHAACLGSVGNPFSLYFYSHHKMQISSGFWDLPFQQSLEDAWSGKSAGGSSLHASFMHNPQYAVQVHPDNLNPASCLLVTLRSARQDLLLSAQLVWGSGMRVTSLSQGDLVASSGAYDNRIVYCESTAVKPGKYTLVLSTYEPGQEAEYTLQVACSSRVDITSIPQEGSGMFARSSRSAWKVLAGTAAGSPSHGRYECNPRFLLQLSSAGSFLARLQVGSGARPRPPINVSVFRHHAPTISIALGAQVATSGPYDDALCGVMIDQSWLEAGEYVVVASTYMPGSEASFVLYAYAQSKFQWTAL
ncbi:cysteine proteinase [Tilletiaria anomala UBC 951]|uniref:Cysteine proteinase n=1 Tax=Tilletiaria anomala (strain ATCC 24038 / CBS 436.72 / UBC 951) TaxID=1037660 RepID=A0A066W7T1_TILAU|nr:cysteine proteinase [Tilletiaria anomala UBC 951]KDN47144.1 cysteine proteinase [Tilletiaria anomala UBC 951]